MELLLANVNSSSSCQTRQEVVRKEADTTNPVIFSPGVSPYQFFLMPGDVQENGVSAGDLGRDEAAHVQQK